MAQKFPAIAGFSAGVILMLVAGALGSVMFTGAGLSDRNGGETQVIYPNF